MADLLVLLPVRMFICREPSKTDVAFASTTGIYAHQRTIVNIIIPKPKNLVRLVFAVIPKPLNGSQAQSGRPSLRDQLLHRRRAGGRGPGLAKNTNIRIRIIIIVIINNNDIRIRIIIHTNVTRRVVIIIITTKSRFRSTSRMRAFRVFFLSPLFLRLKRCREYHVG